MVDHFVLLTPLLLLAVTALLGFVGCDAIYGLEQHPPAVAHVATTVKSAAAGTNTITSDPLTLAGGEMIIATLQWRSPSAQQPEPLITGGNFQKVPGGGPFDWNSMKVQSFFAPNAQGSTSVSVTAFVQGGSNVQWNLCVSAYMNVRGDLVGSQQSGPASLGTTVQTQAAIGIDQGDLVYAVAFAANNDGTFPGTVAVSAGSGFTAESAAPGNPLVEDGAPNSEVTAQATVSGDPNPRAFLFAVAIKGKQS